MSNNLDSNNKKLEFGIYKSEISGNLFYFSGEYNNYGDPLFEDIKGETDPFPIECSGALKRLTNEEIRKEISWLEKGLAK
jgi:hypothetical protein